MVEAVAPYSGLGHPGRNLSPSECSFTKPEAKPKQSTLGKKKSSKQKSNRPKVDLGKLLVKPGTSPKNQELDFIEIKLDSNPVKKSVDFRSKMKNQKDYLPQNVHWPSIMSNRNPQDTPLVAGSQQSSVQSLKPRLQKRLGENLERFPGEDHGTQRQLIDDYYKHTVKRKQSQGLK